MLSNPFLDAARSGQNDLWRYVVTVILTVVVLLLGSTCLALPAVAMARGPDFTALPPAAQMALALLPFGFLLLGLWIGLRVLHRRRLSSAIFPQGRFNWANLLGSALLWLALSALSDVGYAALRPGAYHFSFDPGAFWPYLVVAVLLLPIQVLAEEVYFRGYLTQGFALAWGRYAAWIIPAVLFGLLHGFNPEVGAYGMMFTFPVYIGLGLLLGWVTLRSAGLEMALGLHLANNLYGAVIVAPEVSALSGPSLFQLKYDPLVGLAIFFIMALVYLGCMAGVGRRFFFQKAWNGWLVVVLLLPLMVTACAPAQKAAITPTAAKATLPLADCRLKTLSGSQIKARCGKLKVAEDPAAPTGSQIELNIAVIPAVSRSPEPDPLFLLAGGPGQAATEAFVSQVSALQRVVFKRDLVMVDQRGTGQSHPLKCDSTASAEAEAGAVVGVEVPIEKQLADLAKCRSALGTEPRLYTTDIAMQDLDQVRQALGYERINLLGVSYGTRAAQEYLRLFPDHTRSLILDGVVPPGMALGVSSGVDAQQALDKIFQRCEGDTDGCNKAYPGLREAFSQLSAKLKAQPVEVSVAHPTSGKPTRVLVSARLLSTAVRLMSYSDVLTALLPLAIANAGRGDYALLASNYLLMVEQLGESLNQGMYYSVVCAEDAPRYPDTLPASSTFFDPQLDQVRAACKLWLPNPPAVEETTLKSDVPVFLISGAADPVTPPANADQVAILLPNNLNLVLPGLGHNNFYAGCVPNLLYNFLDAASPKIDTKCVTNIQPEPFFTSPSGPKP